MGKVIGFLLLTLTIYLSMRGDEFSAGSVEFREGDTYLCLMGESLILELPENEKYSIDLQGNSNWEVECIWNLVWAAPKTTGDALHLLIRNGKNRQVNVSLRSIRIGTSTAKKIIVHELREIPIGMSPIPPITTNAKPLTEKEPATSAANPETPAQVDKDKDKKENDKKIDIQTQFGLTGGVFSINRRNHFALNGDVLVAGKSPHGLFMQFSAMADLNGFQKRIGQSIGAGFENDKLGFFLFIDSLQLKLDQYNLTWHYQLRPAIRIRSNRMHLSGFIALPISSDQYTGQEDPQDPEMGVFNNAVLHFGFDVRTLVSNRLMFHAFGLVGGTSVYRMGAGFEFHFAKNICLLGNFYSTNYGNYPLLTDVAYNNSVEFSVGLRVGMGKELKFSDMKTQIAFPVDYPIVNNQKKKLENSKKKSELSITLSADPVRGYAPLAVRFITEIRGGQEPYQVEILPMYRLSNMKVMGDNAYVYSDPGEYMAKAWVTDSTGKKAESNSVLITVVKSDKPRWNVIVTAGTGGRVNPGSTQVEDGLDSPVYYIQEDSGYVIDYVMIDGVNKGALSQYQFKNVKANHNLEAFFRTSDTPVNKYTIDSSAGTGLSISPAGSRQYNAGSSADYTVSVIDANYEIARVIVDGATVATNPTSPYTYHFSNIQANHTINATSRLKTFTITATAGPNGTIAPSGAVVVNIGSSQGFTVTANGGYDIDVVTVDGGNVATSPVSPYSYTFSNVQANHTINATFKQKLPTVFVDFHGPGHTDPGYGNYEKLFGSSMTINCIPNAGAEGDYIEVDGYRQAYQSSWTFSNIQSNHSFVAYFKSAPPPKVTVTIYDRIYDDPSGQPIVVIPTEIKYDPGQTVVIFKPRNHPQYPNYILNSVLLDGAGVPLLPGGGCTITIPNIQVNHLIVASYYK